MRVPRNRASLRPDGLRASDAERDQAISELRERFAEGRLSQDTFMHRMDAALRSRERSELCLLLADMPGSRLPGSRLPGSDLPGSDLPGSDLPGSHLPGSHLPGSHLPWSHLPWSQHAGRLADRALTRARSTAQLVAAAFQPPRWPDLVLPRAGQGTLTIGRDADCDLVLDSLSVSRYHAELHRGAGCWLLGDLGSTNGTRLNGWRVRSPVAVRAGDKVSFGEMTFVLCDRG